jgi:hypothetical protein
LSGYGLTHFGKARSAVIGRFRLAVALRTPYSPWLGTIGGVLKVPSGTYENGWRCGGGCERDVMRDVG